MTTPWYNESSILGNPLDSSAQEDWKGMQKDQSNGVTIVCACDDKGLTWSGGLAWKGWGWRKHNLKIESLRLTNREEGTSSLLNTYCGLDIDVAIWQNYFCFCRGAGQWTDLSLECRQWRENFPLKLNLGGLLGLYKERHSASSLILRAVTRFGTWVLSIL